MADDDLTRKKKPLAATTVIGDVLREGDVVEVVAGRIKILDAYGREIDSRRSSHSQRPHRPPWEWSKTSIEAPRNPYVANVLIVNNYYGTTIKGDVSITGPVQNAFNTINNLAASGSNDALAKELNTLSELTAQLIERLPDAEKASVARKLDNVAAEAASNKPDKGLLKVSAEGLIEAAKTVAEMAAPITAAVKAVLALLAM